MVPCSALADLAQRYWQFECEESPFAAILAGEPTQSPILFRESAADHARRYGAAASMLGELASIPAAQLSAQEKATHRLLERELTGMRRQYEVGAFLRPSLLPVGPDFNTVFFANSASIASAAAAALYVQRLESIPSFIDDVMNNMKAGYAKEIRYPRAVLEGAVANTRGIAAAVPEASPWYGPFKRSPVAASPAVAAQAERALACIRERIVPALHTYAEFLSTVLSKGARDSIACTDAPGGHEYYRFFAGQFTSTDLEPEQIHELGLSEVARLERELEAVAADAGFAGDLAGYRQFLSSDAQFVAPSVEHLRQTLESLCKRVDRKIPAYFARVPRITYGVEMIPEPMSAALPAGYAQPSPADGSSAGIFWATSILKKCPSFLHVPLVVHEAWPGHLMHIALLQELTELPAFRRHGAVKYTAYVEGWALYCESLAVEMGLYETPHQHYGRLEMEMWRALRLVVDTGIHWYGWSREHSIDYMCARMALDRATITSEVDRYAALPGQALAYQIGNLKIRELRKKAQVALGSRFAHRDFHTALMTSGAVPLPVLESLIDDWIADSVAAGAPLPN